MAKVKAYGASAADQALGPMELERRTVGPDDVAIDILFCGVCHSDIHAAKDDFGSTRFPIVPGHEIIGTVTAVGENVKRWKAGDTVGVGCMVNSCRTCQACQEHEEQYCESGMTATYNSIDKHGDGSVTKGGYSSHIVVNQDFVLRIPDGMPLDRTAPMLCAGITTYSPLKRYGVKQGDNVAVVGLGGLGHMAVKIAKAMGAHVTMVSHSENKKADAQRLGADDFLLTRDPGVFKENRKRFDFILDTISAPHDLNLYLDMLKRHGTMVVVGLARSPELNANVLIHRGRRLAGSLIGGVQETQEMLDFCAAHNVYSDIELIGMEEINTAYERMLKSDVRYRFVIDMASLRKGAA